MKSNGQDIQIRQSLGGPFIMAKFEIAENNLMSLNAEIRRLSNEIDHDVQIMRQVVMFIDQLSSPFGFLKKAAHNVEQAQSAREGLEIKEELEGDLGSIAFHQFEMNLQKQFDEKA